MLRTSIAAACLALLAVSTAHADQHLCTDAHMTAQTIISWVITADGGIVAVSGGWMLSQSEPREQG